MKTNPDAAAAVLINGGRLIAGQTLRFTVHAEQIVAQAIQAAVHPYPEIALGVFENAAHPLALVRASQWAADKAPVFQPRQSAIGPGPQISVAVFPQRAHEVVGQSVFATITAQFAGWAARQDAEASGHPKVAFPVLHQRADNVADFGGSEDRHELVAF